MKICDGLELDPETFHAQVGSLRHVRRDPRQVVGLKLSLLETALNEGVNWSQVKNNLRSMSDFTGKLGKMVQSENAAAVANMCVGIIGVAARLAGIVTGDKSIHKAGRTLQEKIHAAAKGLPTESTGHGR